MRSRYIRTARRSHTSIHWVPTGSMNPTILEGDFVYVDKLAYDLRVPLTLQRLKSFDDPERGDIVVFLSPEDGTRMVKRVMGLPGDTLQVVNNVLILNGKPLSYSPLSSSLTEGMPDSLQRKGVYALEELDSQPHAVMALPFLSTPSRNMPATVVPEGQYFMMGDNRDNSHDSRSYGFVERRLILGRARRVLVSLNIQELFQPRLDRFGMALDAGVASE